MLLVRLCAMFEHDANTDDDDATNQFAEELDRLNEALVSHKVTAHSKVSRDAIDKTVARRFSGRRDDGELSAIGELLKAADYHRLVNILNDHFPTIRRLVSQRFSI